MAGPGGFAMSRSHGGDRFYNPPAMRRQQQMFRRQQQRPLQPQTAAKLAEVESRDETDDSVTTLSQPPTINSFSPAELPPTNLDRLLESVTPYVTAQCFSEEKAREYQTREAELHPFYCLEDLWESFSEWSVYGVGVPLVLNGKYPVKQYYVPLLSGIQLYVDPSKSHSQLRRLGEDSDADSSRETRTGGSSDFEGDKQSKSSVDGMWNQRSVMNLNIHSLNRLSLREASVTSTSGAEAEGYNSPGQLLFEYLEQEQPHSRRPLADKISVLASEFPDLRKLRSCDLLPASWISVAWYPIYRIPLGPSLNDLEASFLTFHCLSTRSKSNAQQPFHGVGGQKVNGFGDASLKMSLPIFGLASYKWRGSTLTPSGPHECERESSLLQAAENWLQDLHVGLPDYYFFRAHYSHWR